MRDEITAVRRQLPMVRLRSGYEFTTASGPRTLLDLLGDHQQFGVQQLMDSGPDHFSPVDRGSSMGCGLPAFVGWLRTASAG